MINDALVQKERQLGLLLALDQARDRDVVITDPVAMLEEIVQLLAAHFDVEACALMLLDDAGVEVEQVICHDVDESTAIVLCKQALHVQTPAPITTEYWAHTLGLQILLREDDRRPLGGLFVARNDASFGVADVNLLRLAESQIDSAIIQARTLYRLARRNRELEAIRRIDELRDAAKDEGTLLGGFSALIGEYLSASLCLIFIEDPREAELLLRGITDRYALLPEQLADIRLSIDALKQKRTLSSTNVADLQIIAMPLQIQGDRLGVVVVGREQEFDDNAIRMLEVLAAQMDSALVHSRAVRQLHQRNRELEAIYEIDRIRDTESDFNALLDRVLQVLCRAVSAEIGYLVLYNAQNESQLERKVSTRNDLLASPDYLNVIQSVSRHALDTGETILERFDNGPVRSVIAVPLILDDRVIGVFGAINSVDGFDDEDKGLLRAITSQVDTAIFERLEHRRLRKVLRRSVDPKVIDHLLAHTDEDILAGERVVLSVLFADLRGSTEWAERIKPEELVSSLNLFLATMTRVIFNYGGTLDKFVGDEIIALFGSPLPMDDHAFHAAEAALKMQELHAEIRADLQSQGKELPPMGVAISSGEVIAGEFGPPARTDFTAMGRTMNLGSRLCGATESDKVYITGTTRHMLGERAVVRELAPVKLKGIGDMVETFELLRLHR